MNKVHVPPSKPTTASCVPPANPPPPRARRPAGSTRSKTRRALACDGQIDFAPSTHALFAKFSSSALAPSREPLTSPHRRYPFTVRGDRSPCFPNDSSPEPQGLHISPRQTRERSDGSVVFAPAFAVAAFVVSLSYNNSHESQLTRRASHYAAPAPGSGRDDL